MHLERRQTCFGGKQRPVGAPADQVWDPAAADFLFASAELARQCLEMGDLLLIEKIGEGPTRRVRFR